MVGRLLGAYRAVGKEETQQELHQARLLNRQKLEGESLRSLAADIHDACSLAYQDLPLLAQERFCIQHFIDAVKKSSLRMIGSNSKFNPNKLNGKSGK